MYPEEIIDEDFPNWKIRIKDLPADKGTGLTQEKDTNEGFFAYQEQNRRIITAVSGAFSICDGYPVINYRTPLSLVNEILSNRKTLNTESFWKYAKTITLAGIMGYCGALFITAHSAAQESPVNLIALAMGKGVIFSLATNIANILLKRKAEKNDMRLLKGFPDYEQFRYGVDALKYLKTQKQNS